MKNWLAMSAAAFALGGCAFQKDVEHIGIGYNNAVADLSNQVTLLNIVRAENRQPLHFMAFSRLSGSLTFTGSGSFNAAVHDTGKTATTTSETDVAGLSQTSKMSATPETDITNPVTTTKNTVANALASGGHVYTPSVSAQVVTGPSFDMDLLDTQSFYQGITGQTPITTIEALQSQGFDGRLLLALFVERIDFTALPDPAHDTIKFEKGVLLQSLVNDPESDQGELFMTAMCGASLSSQGASSKKLYPFSQFATATGRSALTLKDLAALDGKALDLDKDVAKIGDAKNVIVIRPSDKRVAKFNWAGCPPFDPPANFPHRAVAIDKVAQAALQGEKIDAPIDKGGMRFARKNPLPTYPDLEKDPGQAKQLIADSQDADTDKKAAPVIDTAPVDFFDAQGNNLGHATSAVSVVLRSPEGVVRYLGAYLRALRSANQGEGSPPAPYLIQDDDDPAHKIPVFKLEEELHAGPTLVSAELGGTRYSIAGKIGVDESAQAIRDMQILAILEELIDLQKSGTDRPSTVPVQVVP